MKQFLAIVFFLICVKLNAQTHNANVGILIGNILESETSNAVDGATVMVKRLDDTLFARQQVTGKDGSFEIDKLPFGLYRLSVTAVGFAAVTIDSIHIRAERYDFNLGDVKVSKSTAHLQEVVVYAEKPLIENTDGKITYNVGESALSAGSSTSEILKTMPMISNDPEGKILLKGKEPKILIDDKPTDLNAQQLSDLLESLPGSSIEKIELMTNPPAQYATEAGGVINIVTRKGKVGLVGKVTVSGGSRGEGNLSSNISYREKKLTLSTTVGFGVSQLNGTSYSRRQNFYKDSTNYFNTDGSFENKNIRPNIRLQGDYELNKQNSVNAVIQSNYNFFDNYSFTQYTNLNRNSDIYKLSTRENSYNGDGFYNSLTLSYLFRKANSAERLQLIASGNLGKNDNGRDYFQEFLTPDFRPTGVDSSQNQATDVYNNAYSFRVNYDKPLKLKGWTVSTGASYTKSTYHNVLNTSFLKKPEREFVISDVLSNDFFYRQELVTARVSLSYVIKNSWRFIGGLQAEETGNSFEFIKGNGGDVRSSYWNYLPNATIRKDFSKAFNTSFVYRQTIRRPGIGELNPSINYNDPYNIRFGNPYLSPTIAHNFDWNVGLSKGKYYFNTSVGYNKVKDIFHTIRTLIESGKTETTYQNIASRNEYEGSIWGGYTFSRKLRMNASAGYSYNEYSETERTLFKYRNGGTIYTSVNYNFILNTNTSFDGSTRYSSFSDPQGKARSNLSMNLGFQKKLFNKRLIIGFNVIDPFRVQKFTTYTYGSNFSLENFSSSNTRNFRISVSYQLNKMVKSKVSDKQKKAAIEKIKNKAATQ